MSDRPRLLHSSGDSDQPGAHQALMGSQAADPPLFPEPPLMQEIERVSLELESSSAEDILQWAVHRFGDKFTMATAFGPEGMVILEMLSRISPNTYVFNLDTGYQFRETLELREKVLQLYGIAVDLLQPAQTVAEYESMHGGPLYKTNANQCCFDRKIVVLRQAALGRHAWASAIRRDQSPDRLVAPIVGWDKKFHLVKISPLANWKKGDVWKRILDRKIPYNPLHDQGYPSIGCWPCTRSTVAGEDERAGRWSGTEKKECGLHTEEEPPTK